MRTSKPIAGISYNSANFLANYLNRLKGSGIISFASWIKHEAEENEKKPHFHVFLIPSKMLQTDKVEKDSEEFDENKPQFPLKMVGLSASVFGDWYWYCLHDIDYLSTKGLIKKYHYKEIDFNFTDEDTFFYYVGQAGELKQTNLEKRLIEAIEANYTWDNIVRSGLIPLRNILHAKEVYNTLRYSRNIRREENGKKS